MSFFEPSPVLLGFLFVQRFVFFEALTVLALLRLMVGQGAARLPALVSLLICAAAIFATFAPALGWQDLPAYPPLARALAYQGGVALPLIASAVFLTSLACATRRWRWIDIVHVLGLLAYLGLWIATKV